MRDKFTVDLDRVADSLLPKRAFRLADVQHRLERVAYDLVRFRDNEDTDQLWRIQDSHDGPVIVALYGDDGSLTAESDTEPKNDWEAVPDKMAMHFYYKGEPIISLSSDQLGIPEDEFNLARRWLPKKVAQNEELQQLLFGNVSRPVRKLIAQRFPELTKVAMPEGTWEDEPLTEGEEAELEAEYDFSPKYEAIQDIIHLAPDEIQEIAESCNKLLEKLPEGSSSRDTVEQILGACKRGLEEQLGDFDNAE